MEGIARNVEDIHVSAIEDCRGVNLITEDIMLVKQHTVNDWLCRRLFRLVVAPQCNNVHGKSGNEDSVQSSGPCFKVSESIIDLRSLGLVLIWGIYSYDHQVA